MKYNLEFNQIWTLRISHLIIYLAQKLKISWDTWCTIGLRLIFNLDFNLIFFEFWLLIYIYVQIQQWIAKLCANPLTCPNPNTTALPYCPNSTQPQFQLCGEAISVLLHHFCFNVYLNIYSLVTLSQISFVLFSTFLVRLD